MKYLKIKLCALTAGILLLATGCSQQEPVTYEAKSFEAPAAEVTEVTVDVQDRKIEVLEAEDDTIRLEYAESEKEFYAVAVSENGVLSMTCADEKAWSDYIGGKVSQSDRTIKLYLPQKGLQGLSLRTTNEDLTLPSLAVSGTAELSVNNGNLQLAGLAAGEEIKLDAKNGSIKGTLAGAYEDYAITSQIKKGKSNLPETKEDGTITLVVSANNGDVNLEFTGAA